MLPFLYPRCVQMEGDEVMRKEFPFSVAAVFLSLQA